MPSRALPRFLPALMAALTLAGCGSGGGGGLPPGGSVGTCGDGSGPAITINGQILYTRLTYGPGGLGPSTENRPARFVDVELLEVGGSGLCYGRTSTDGSGNYTLVANPPAGTLLNVTAWSRTSEDPDHDVTVHESIAPTVPVHDPNNAFQHASGVLAAISQAVNLTVPYTGGPSNRPSIGFGALDVVLHCWDEVTSATGVSLPALQVYTRLGNNASEDNISYYNPYAGLIALLGGSSSFPDGSDTDYFDDGVIAHEFSHFADRVLSHSWSRGGPHGGEILEPNFSWSEGSATGFGQLLLGSRFYVDSTGTNGVSQFTMNVENATQFDNDGIGDEFSVSEILWDLADDGTADGDSDADGVSVPLGDLYAAMQTFDPASDGPYIGLLLQRFVALSASVDTTGMAAFLDGQGSAEDQKISFPPAGADVFPTVLTLGGSGTGLLDGTNPVLNTCRRMEASAWYHLTIAATTNVTIDLSMTPLGGTPGNLDLYLFHNDDVQWPGLASSTNSGATAEQISLQLSPGTYVIRVEASCGDSQASYQLQVN